MRISDWSSDVCSSDLQTAQRRLLAQFLKVRLFRLRYDDRRTEQRVAQAVPLTRPCYPIIDDVGIYGGIFPNLTNLSPTIHGEKIHGTFNCSPPAFHKYERKSVASGKMESDGESRMVHGT